MVINNMDKSSGLISELKSQALKKKLLDCLDTDARQFSEMAREYVTRGQLSKEDKAGLLTGIIAAIDHILEAGDWNSSLFLRNTLKPLVAIKVEAETELARFAEKAGHRMIQKHVLTEAEVEVYISLFQSDGYNIAKWAMQLRSLDRYIIGRPVYQNEADVEKRIRLRSAAGVANEAYVTVAVKKTDIQSDQFPASLKDQFGNPLLQLKETAVRDGKIDAFVHQGMRYAFVDGQLIKE